MRTPPPICTSAPNLNPALVSRAVGAANALRDTSGLVSRNENDSSRLPPKTTWRSPTQAAAILQSRKILNLCEDSKRKRGVAFSALAQNKFINCLLSGKAEANFQTTPRRYADK
jgi:hypothetical protein